MDAGGPIADAGSHGPCSPFHVGVPGRNTNVKIRSGGAAPHECSSERTLVPPTDTPAPPLLILSYPRRARRARRGGPTLGSSVATTTGGLPRGMRWTAATGPAKRMKAGAVGMISGTPGQAHGTNGTGHTGGGGPGADGDVSAGSGGQGGGICRNSAMGNRHMIDISIAQAFKHRQKQPLLIGGSWEKSSYQKKRGGGIFR